MPADLAAEALASAAVLRAADSVAAQLGAIAVAAMVVTAIAVDTAATEDMAIAVTATADGADTEAGASALVSGPDITDTGMTRITTLIPIRMPLTAMVITRMDIPTIPTATPTRTMAELSSASASADGGISADDNRYRTIPVGI